MADRDPFPMRSEEARRLAESVQPSGDDGNDDGGGGGGGAWYSMRMSLAQRVPSFRGRRSGVGDGGATDGRESLTGGGSSKNISKKGTSSGREGGSIYERDEIDEMHGDEGDRYDDGDDDEDGEGDGDDFFDRPISSTSRGFFVLRPSDVRDLPRPLGAMLLCLQSCCLSLRGSARALHYRMYGDAFPWEDFVRATVLSSTLFTMIGGYWLLRSLKDPVLTALCGVTVIPKAKMLSVFVVLGVVAVYNHLLDEESGFRKEQLFYVFGSFYFCVFCAIAFLLDHPVYGLANETEDPSRILGWVSYCAIESFGSVMVSLFWSFANSNFDLKQAKRSYGMMVATAQLGSILGPTFVNHYGATIGIPKCYMAGAMCMLVLQFTMWTYVQMYGVKGGEIVHDKKEDSPPSSSPPKKNKAGILEGIHLFAKHDYVKGIFAISCLFMVEVTIVDYTMKVLARDHFTEEHPCLPADPTTGLAMTCWDDQNDAPAGMSAEATRAFTAFMGLFGQATNTLSFFLSFFGTSAIIRALGLRTTLLLFPSICLVTIIVVRFYPNLNVVFAAMMILKANSYALNNPTKEMLYQPTSESVKYKAKSWIDIFGARGSKALGSVVTNAFSSSAVELIDKGSLVGMCVASFLIWNARFMGRKFEEYTEAGYVVGEKGGDDDEDGEDGEGYREVDDGVVEEEEEEGADGGKKGDVEMAARQNEAKDTSCAFLGDDEIGAEEEGQSQSEGRDGDDDDDGLGLGLDGGEGSDSSGGGGEGGKEEQKVETACV